MDGHAGESIQRMSQCFTENAGGCDIVISVDRPFSHCKFQFQC